MATAIQWIDQTLGLGLQQGLKGLKLELLLDNLLKLPIGVMDVWIEDWKHCGLKWPELTSYPQLRGKVTADPAQVFAAQQLGFKKILLSYRHDEMADMEGLKEALRAAEGLSLEADLLLENASAISTREVVALAKELHCFSIRGFAYGDEESRLEPLAALEQLAFLQTKLPMEMEFHGHNAYGLATANALSAIRVGIRHIAATAGNLTRNGYAPLEEVVMGSKILLGEETTGTEKFVDACEGIAACFDAALPVNKAIVGKHVFAHESGLHVDGVIKNPSLYEAFSPKDVGAVRRLVIGKHSGTASLKNCLAGFGISLASEAGKNLLQKVRRLAVLQKRALTEEQLLQLYCESNRQVV
ncbi:homocitrate synthase/isopropylmalate synthase family protein [Azotosporobacter soli]|uniref:homocitrate synthase/isopropylmalate synthase family protein n=1 Tax=Azotosporobacter soli TaxID=3055040 RepID=UPI0031FE71DF